MAPAHEKKDVKAKLPRAVPSLLPWTPKGADMSPLDFSIWGWMDNKLAEYRESNEIKNEDDITTALMWLHAQIPQSLVDKAIDSLVSRINIDRKSVV